MAGLGSGFVVTFGFSVWVQQRLLEINRDHFTPFIL